MQAWNQVKVIDKADQFFGRAGVVESVDATGRNRVRIDADDQRPADRAFFTDDQLQLLGN